MGSGPFAYLEGALRALSNCANKRDACISVSEYNVEACINARWIDSSDCSICC